MTLKKISESLQCSAKTPSISYSVKDPSATYDWDWFYMGLILHTRHINQQH